VRDAHSRFLLECEALASTKTGRTSVSIATSRRRRSCLPRSLVAQQRRFDRFPHIFNYERPHEAAGGEVPASVYTRASREMPRRVESPTYPSHFEVRTIDAAGTLQWDGWRSVLSGALAHEPVGLEALTDGAWTIHFDAAARRRQCRAAQTRAHY
jgi:hypothetical protein